MQERKPRDPSIAEILAEFDSYWAPETNRRDMAAGHFADLLDVVNAQRGAAGRHAIGFDDLQEAA